MNMRHAHTASHARAWPHNRPNPISGRYRLAPAREAWPFGRHYKYNW